MEQLEERQKDRNEYGPWMRIEVSRRMRRNTMISSMERISPTERTSPMENFSMGRKAMVRETKEDQLLMEGSNLVSEKGATRSITNIETKLQIGKTDESVKKHGKRKEGEDQTESLEEEATLFNLFGSLKLTRDKKKEATDKGLDNPEIVIEMKKTTFEEEKVASKHPQENSKKREEQVIQDLKKAEGTREEKDLIPMRSTKKKRDISYMEDTRKPKAQKEQAQQDISSQTKGSEVTTT